MDTTVEQIPDEIDLAIEKAEAQFNQNGKLYDAREALAWLREKYFPHS